MGDPLEGLRDTGASSEPDISRIKARARRIERRRRGAIAGGGVAVALLAAVGIVLTTSDPEIASRRIAQAPLTTLAPEVPTPGTEAAAEAWAPFTDEAVPGEARSESQAPAAGAGHADGRLQATLEVEEVPRGAALTLEVCNPGGEEVERDFGDGQRYDFEVHRDGALVWRWSDDQVFTQALGHQRWGPGECVRWSEPWDGTGSNGLPAAPGPYEAAGILTTTPELRTEPVAFCLDAC